MSELPSNNFGDSGKVLDLFNEEPEKEVKSEVEVKPTKEPEDIELVEKEEDEVEKLDLDKDKDEDDKDEIKEEDEIKIDVPPRKRDVQAKYPNFFKEFPFFEKLMFRDKQYTELFGSYDDAKEVAEKATILDRFEADILNGDTEKILASVKNSDKKAFDKIVDNYLPTLAKVDKDAYFEVIGNVTKHIIKQMVAEGKSSENEDLQKAALFLNQFMFGSSTYVPPKPRVGKEEPQNNELEQEKHNYIMERYTESRNNLQTKVDNVLKATISEYIDPNGIMTPYVKKNAVNDALKSLHNMVNEDTAFRKTLDKLWEAAFNAKFDQASLNRVRAAYLGRSKPFIRSVIKNARAEALKDAKPSSRVSDEDNERPRNRETLNSGRPRQTSGKLKMEPGESVLEFFSRD